MPRISQKTKRISPASKKRKVKKIRLSPKRNTKKKETKNVKKINTPNLLRGFKDILPETSKYFVGILNTAQNISEAYNYSYIETPILEPAQLFIRSLGKATDVVDKEMYIFDNKEGGKICLRPEATASIARAYINHGLQTKPQPIKVWYLGPMFRHDRPQAGRYRQFHQFGCESIGERDPIVDAELISLAYNFFLDLGIKTVVHINSIGNLEERENYLAELVAYLKLHKNLLSTDSKKRLTKNPLRIFDSKDERDQQIMEEAPQIIDWLTDESRDYFTEVLEYLDQVGVNYILKPTLVRGLDYYTDTVFEFYLEEGEETSQSALAGGGRYDGLIEYLGGQEVPACGFAIGVERVMNILQARDEEKQKVYLSLPKKERPRVLKGVFLAQLGKQAKKQALYLIERLRKDGLKIYHNLAKSSIKTQLESADKLNVAYTLILGQKEVQEESIIIRDMESGVQEIIPQSKLKQKILKIKDEEKIINPGSKRKK